MLCRTPNFSPLLFGIRVLFESPPIVPNEFPVSVFPTRPIRGISLTSTLHREFDSKIRTPPSPCKERTSLSQNLVSVKVSRYCRISSGEKQTVSFLNSPGGMRSGNCESGEEKMTLLCKKGALRIRGRSPSFQA